MKAQVAIEFMIIFATFLLALTLIALAAWNNIVNTNESALNYEANRILNLATGRINTVYLEGHGFSIGLVIPEKIGVHDYTFEIEGTNMFISVEGVSFSKRIITPNITGILNKGENTLENVNGVVVVS